MARYATSEPMYQCKTPSCRIWYSDREGIKEVTACTLIIALGSGAEIRTHIGCPKCHLNNPLEGNLQLRHVVDVMENSWQDT